MQEHPPVRFGVIGAGRIAQNFFVPALRNVPTATLAAAASRDLERARSLGPERAHDNYQALLDDDDVEAVYVATHNGLHRELTLGALERGKHVLCEKPLGRDAAECEEMIAAARAADRHLVEAFMYRHHPQIEKACELVAGGSIGDLMTVEAAFSFHLTAPDDVRLNPQWGGGGLLDVGSYCVNISRLFLGNEPRAVQATGNFHPDHGVDMSLHGLLDYGDGRHAVISCGFDGGLRNHVFLSGTKGVVSLPQAFISWNTDPVVILETDDGQQEFRFPQSSVFELEIDDLARSIRTGQPPKLDPEEGLHNARIMDALLHAARNRSEGKP